MVLLLGLVNFELRKVMFQLQICITQKVFQLEHQKVPKFWINLPQSGLRLNLALDNIMFFRLKKQQNEWKLIL